MAAYDASYLLLAAFVAKWGASSTLDDISGPHLHRKPPDLDVGFAYCTLEASATLEQWTCARQYWLVTLIVSVYDKTPELAATSLKLINDIFEVKDLTMTFPAGGLVNHRLVDDAKVEDEPGDVEHAEATYEFRIWRPLAT